MQAPWPIRWFANILWTLPAPTETWADIVGHLAWPALVLFLVIRYRIFLRRLSLILVDRLETDHIKFGWFEIRPNDQVIVLDPEDAADSSLQFEPVDIQRIERIFEFINTEENFDVLREWMNKTLGPALDIEEFTTLPAYARERERAFAEVEGLAL
jgi:hypothetical protein